MVLLQQIGQCAFKIKPPYIALVETIYDRVYIRPVLTAEPVIVFFILYLSRSCHRVRVCVAPYIHWQPIMAYPAAACVAL